MNQLRHYKLNQCRLVSLSQLAACDIRSLRKHPFLHALRRWCMGTFNIRLIDLFVSSQIEYFNTVLFMTEESLTAFENAQILLSIPTYIILNS